MFATSSFLHQAPTEEKNAGEWYQVIEAQVCSIYLSVYAVKLIQAYLKVKFHLL